MDIDKYFEDFSLTERATADQERELLSRQEASVGDKIAKIRIRQEIKAEGEGERGMTVEARAVRSYGEVPQMYKAIEECAELIDALMKYIAGRCDADHVREEMADVQIMLDQLRLTRIGSDIEWRQRKLARLEERLDADGQRAD